MSRTADTGGRWWREPLVHFLVIGALLFVAFHWGGDGGAGRIVITPGQVDAMVAGFARTWQRPPTEQELKGLLDDYVREEIATREAMALGLDRDDTIIRRRLRQKLEFPSDDSVDATPPTDAELQAWLDAHPDAFRSEPEVAFRQVYLSQERGTRPLDAEARRLLAALAGAGAVGEIEALGDSHHAAARGRAIARSQVAREFGDEFADAVTTLAPGRWSGPIQSGYGLHLVLVRERVEARLPRARRGAAAGRARVHERAPHARARTRCTSACSSAIGCVIEKRPGRAAGCRRARGPGRCAVIAVPGRGRPVVGGRPGGPRRCGRGPRRTKRGPAFSSCRQTGAGDLQLPLEEAVGRRDRDLHRADHPAEECRLATAGQQQLTPGALIVRGTLTLRGRHRGQDARDRRARIHDHRRHRPPASRRRAAREPPAEADESRRSRSARGPPAGSGRQRTCASASSTSCSASITCSSSSACC